LTGNANILQAARVNAINLYEFALERARDSVNKRQLHRVAKESGLDYSWLGKFARGVIPGASYEKVYRLASYYMADAPVGPGSEAARSADGAGL